MSYRLICLIIFLIIKRQILLRYLYTTLFYLLLPFIGLRLLWRSRRTPAYRHGWAERLGYCLYQFKQSIWIHAVSLGETIAAEPLIRELLKIYPTLPIVVTNTTPTGAARVQATFSNHTGRIYQVYLPYDLPSAVGRFLKKIQPKMAIILETELWPNLFAACEKKNIPIILANACLSTRSLKGYARFSTLTQQTLSAVTNLCAQTQQDADRFHALGISSEKIKITGSLKLDITLPEDLLLRAAQLRKKLGENRLIWIAASTHKGEEEIILQAHRLILKNHPSSLLILAPRHPERFDRLADNLIKEKWMIACHSKQESCDKKTAIYFNDTLGELLLMYAVSDVAFVGGSFVPIGGHNLVEPAILSKPIITGSHIANIHGLSELLLKNQSMLIVKNADELAMQISRLFADSVERKNRGEKAYKIVARNRGALQKTLGFIETTLKEAGVDACPT